MSAQALVEVRPQPPQLAVFCSESRGLIAGRIQLGVSRLLSIKVMAAHVVDTQEIGLVEDIERLAADMAGELQFLAHQLHDMKVADE